MVVPCQAMATADEAAIQSPEGECRANDAAGTGNEIREEGSVRREAVCHFRDLPLTKERDS